ncbi:MAG: class I SAM-dependent methyltransferase [Pseudomonadota bacterium]
MSNKDYSSTADEGVEDDLRNQRLDPAIADVYAVFNSIGYQIINARRLEHLATLGIPVRDLTVLELGAGAGGLTSYFINRNCDVTSVEPRAESLGVLAGRFPTVTAMHLDIETDAARMLPKRDVVFSYGLLYHLRDPETALERMSSAAQQLLLLETRVDPTPEEKVELVDERHAEHPSSGMYGAGCRPSRSWVQSQLKRWFPNVYLPRTQPNHPEFPVEWAHAGADGYPTRAIFVASRTPLDHPNLGETIEERQRYAV